MTTQSERSPLHQILHFANMTIEELPGTPIPPSPSAKAMLRGVSDAAKTTMTLWKNRLYGGQGEKNAAASSYSSEEEGQKSESNREDQKEETTTTEGREECNYVQYGIITRRMSAVIEIGEDGGYKSTVAADCQLISGSPLPVVKQDEVIIMKHIASDTSDMTIETSQETCAESVASITQELVSIESNGEDDAASQDKFTQESAEEAAESSEEQGNEYVPAAYSMSSIEQVKAEFANVLIKLSCSSESYESAASAQKKKEKKRRVQFAKVIVSEVRERPRIDPDDVSALFYTISDIERFEDEAEESSCEGSFFSTSFSYTITPTPSYLEGDETDENEAPVATKPTAKGRNIIGPEKVDGLVAGAYETLVAHLSNINTPTNDCKKATPSSDNYGLPSNGAMPISEV